MSQAWKKLLDTPLYYIAERISRNPFEKKEIEKEDMIQFGFRSSINDNTVISFEIARKDILDLLTVKSNTLKRT